MQTRSRSASYFNSLTAALILASAVLTVPAPAAEETPPQQPFPAPVLPNLSDNMEAAWLQVTQSVALLVEPQDLKNARQNSPEWHKLMSFRRIYSQAVIDYVKLFSRSFPGNPHIVPARKIQLKALLLTRGYGHPEVDEIYDAVATDPSIPIGTRFDWRLEQIQTRRGNFYDKWPQMLALQQEFPKLRATYFRMLRMAVQKNTPGAKRLAEAIIASPYAPKSYKETAQRILDGTMFYFAEAIGKPLDMKFTAVDGREVDLAKLKGKVVLIDFWASGITYYPEIRRTYEALHDQGLEIIGISFDNDKETMLQTVRDHGYVWPHYFDGRGWTNHFATLYGVDIIGIPETWLVDRKGNLKTAVSNVNMRKAATEALAEQP